MIGVPWSFINLIMIGYNLFCNISWNQWWAHGNVFLLYNTYYAVIQGALSVWLIFEIPFYMRHFKFFRYISLFAALAYNFVFFAGVIDFLALLFVDEKTQLNLFYMIEAGMFAFSGMVHFPIVILNNAIIFKEFVLEFIHLSISRHGRNNDDHTALGLYDFAQFFYLVLTAVNPLTYLKFARKELYQKLFAKYVMKEK